MGSVGPGYTLETHVGMGPGYALGSSVWEPRPECALKPSRAPFPGCVPWPVSLAMRPADGTSSPYQASRTLLQVTTSFSGPTLAVGHPFLGLQGQRQYEGGGVEEGGWILRNLRLLNF